MATDGNSSNVHAKIAEHDAEIRIIQGDLESLRGSVDQGFQRVFAKVDDLSSSLDNKISGVTQNIHQSSKTNWGWIWAGAGLLLLIGMALLGTFQAHINDGHPGRIESRVNENKDRIERNEQAQLREHEKLESRLTSRLDALEADINRLMDRVLLTEKESKNPDKNQEPGYAMLNNYQIKRLHNEFDKFREKLYSEISQQQQP